MRFLSFLGACPINLPTSDNHLYFKTEGSELKIHSRYSENDSLDRIMHKHFLVAIVFILSATICPISFTNGQPPSRSGYEVNWYDEFTGAALDTSLWTAANTNSPTNNSLQDYLPEQVSVTGGNMVITSENRPSRGMQQSSGLISSNTLQKYGRWDVRAKLPTSTGMWPAIWLLADAPWPSQGEIDIMENRGNQPTLTSSSFHFGTNPPFEHNYVIKEQTSVHDGRDVNYHDSFHTYSVEWDPNQIRFYVDDVQLRTVWAAYHPVHSNHHQSPLGQSQLTSLKHES